MFPSGNSSQRNKILQSKPGLVQRTGSGGSCASNSLKGKMPAQPASAGHSEILRRVASAPISPGQQRQPLLGSAALCSESLHKAQSKLPARAGFQRCKVPNLHGSAYGNRPKERAKTVFRSLFCPACPPLANRPGRKPPQDGAQTQRKKSGRHPPTIRRFERPSGFKACAATPRRLSDAKCSKTGMMLFGTEAGFSRSRFSTGQRKTQVLAGGPSRSFG